MASWRRSSRSLSGFVARNEKEPRRSRATCCLGGYSAVRLSAAVWRGPGWPRQPPAGTVSVAMLDLHPRLCSLCHHPLDGPVVGDGSAGEAMHAACVAARVPHDACVALLGLLVVAVAPPVMVWAG